MAEIHNNTEAEEWRDVPGWDGLYMVSSLGRVKSLPRTVRTGNGWRTTRERIMTLAEDRGYRFVMLSKHRSGKRHGVHRLVCEAFHGPCPPDKRDAAHNDGTRDNNIPDNLRWATRLENALDKWKHGTAILGEACENALLSKSDVQSIRRYIAAECGKIAAHYGVNYSTVVDVVQHKTWKHVR